MVIISTKTILLLVLLIIALWKLTPLLDKYVFQTIKSVVMFVTYRSLGLCTSKGVPTGSLQVAVKAKHARKNAQQSIQQPKSIQPHKVQNKNRRAPMLTTASKLPVPNLFPRTGEKAQVFASRIDSDYVDLNKPSYLRAGGNVKLDSSTNTFVMEKA